MAAPSLRGTAPTHRGPARRHAVGVSRPRAVPKPVPAQRQSAPRVVLAHDYLTQRGGAERVVLTMMRGLDLDRVVTSVYNPDATYPEFRDYTVDTCWLDRFSRFREDPRRALPLLAPAWSRRHVEADVVLCSSSGWSHGVRTDAPKVVYCHNPARWLYQPDEYLRGQSTFPNIVLRGVSGRLLRWDRRAASGAAMYLANSRIVAHRIQQSYGVRAPVLHPPVGLDAHGPQEAVDGIEPGYFLTVGRPRGHKNGDLVAEAVRRIPGARLVAVGGLPAGEWPDRLVGLVGISDAQLRWLYAHATALVSCSHEDFGLTPVEAYSFGTPSVVLKAGGYLDSTLPGVSGQWIETLDLNSVEVALRSFRPADYDAAVVRQHSRQWSAETFARKLRAVLLQAAQHGDLAELDLTDHDHDQIADRGVGDRDAAVD